MGARAGARSKFEKPLIRFDDTLTRKRLHARGIDMPLRHYEEDRAFWWRCLLISRIRWIESCARSSSAARTIA
jgi:hypothetical protein